MLLIVVGLWLVLSFVTRSPEVRTLSLPEYQQALTASEVRTAEFLERDQKVVGELTSGTHYQTSYPSQYQESLTKEILAAPNGVELTTDPQGDSILLTLLFNLLPIILVVGLLLFFMNQMQGGGNRVMSFAKAKPKTVSKDQPKTTFADVAGVDEAVELSLIHI